MSDFSPERFLKIQEKLSSQPFIKDLKREIRYNQQKITKSVYNLESRNIKQFAQEWQTLKKKLKSEASEYPQVKPNQPKKRFGTTLTYEEDATLEFSYDQPQKFKLSEKVEPRRSNQLPKTEEEPLISKHQIKSRYSLKFSKVESVRTREKQSLTREKSNTYMQKSNKSQRMRMISQWEPRREIQSRLSLNKGDSAPNPNPQLKPNEQFIVNLSREKIDKYIQNLHRLEWIYLFIKTKPQSYSQETSEYLNHLRKFKYDIDSSIDQRAINFMISRRYNLFSNYIQDSYEKREKELSKQETSRTTQKIVQNGEYSLLDSLTKESILHLIQKSTRDKKRQPRILQQDQAKKQEPHFSLPYCEFISYRQTKNSIYQLLNMGNRTALKIAFTIYDKNKNGVLDSDDLLQMISLSRSFPFIEDDIAAITRAMMLRPGKVNPSNLVKRRLLSKSGRLQNDSSLKSNRDFITALSKENEELTFSPIKEEYSQSQNQPDQKMPSSSRFSMNKLYTFLKGKKQSNMKQESAEKSIKSLHSLNFGLFCKAFQHHRPLIIYDLFQFLFAAPPQHFHNQLRPLKQIPTKPSSPSSPSLPEEQTLQQKWNRRLKQTNTILQQFIQNKSKSKY